MRRKTVYRSTTVLLVAGLAVGSAFAAVSKPRPGVATIGIPLRATLDSSQAVPAPKVAAPAAQGRFDGLLVWRFVTKKGVRVAAGWSVRWKLSATALTGPPSEIGIYRGAPGETGPVVVSLCTPCGSTPSGVVQNVTGDQAKALRQGPLYVNVATAANPSGEIRGQVVRAVARPVPPKPPLSTKP